MMGLAVALLVVAVALLFIAVIVLRQPWALIAVLLSMTCSLGAMGIGIGVSV